MPIKGIVLLLLIAVIVALLFHSEIYIEIKKFFTNEKDEDEDEDE